MKDFEKGKKVDKQYIFTCRNCKQEVSLPAAATKSGKKMEAGSTENILSLHLMTCDKYVPGTGPATAL